ncbi:MAG: phosphotransferase [Geminicoccaceae bacterium]
MPGLYTDEFVERLRQGARSLVGEWGLSPQTTVELLNISENATFRAVDPRVGQPLVIRVHRPHYHTREEILSELAWIDALRDAGFVNIARPVPLRDGGRIARFALGDDVRDVVAFEFMPGREPSAEEDLEDGFRKLGAISARLHRQTRSWKRPPGFTRKTWNFDTTVGRTPYWGDWREGLGLEAEGRAVLERTAAVLERRLAAFGRGEDRFGLIHADLRLANLLVDDSRIGVIDFDDCGFGWFAFDFAAAISFIETDPSIPKLQAAWIGGYREVEPLDAASEAEMPTFIMLRRLQLTAWIASHRETPTAREMGTAFTDGTIAIAESYLTSPSR